ncbi:MAG: hypothetical protein ABIH39_07015 [Candidatus Margulisiibacteriota bacterium]
MDTLLGKVQVLRDEGEKERAVLLEPGTNNYKAGLGASIINDELFKAYTKWDQAIKEISAYEKQNGVNDDTNTLKGDIEFDFGESYRSRFDIALKELKALISAGEAEKNCGLAGAASILAFSAITHYQNSLKAYQSTGKNGKISADATFISDVMQRWESQVKPYIG